MLYSKPRAGYLSELLVGLLNEVAVAHRMGIDVPGDLTVVGFDDTPIATTIWPELTTIRQPIGDMARSAVELLVRQVTARRAGEEAPPQVVRMDFELVRRQSDAAPRRRPAARVEEIVSSAARTPATSRRSRP